MYCAILCKDMQRWMFVLQINCCLGSQSVSQSVTLPREPRETRSVPGGWVPGLPTRLESAE